MRFYRYFISFLFSLILALFLPFGVGFNGSFPASITGLRLANATSYEVAAKNVNSYGGLEAAVAKIGSTKTAVVINDTQGLTGDLVMPSTLTVHIVSPGLINHGTHDVAINGPFPDPGLVQVFSGTGTVTLSVPIHPEWHGAVGDGPTNDSAAFAACVASIASKGEIILDRNKVYNIQTATAIGTKYVKVSGGGTIHFGADVYFVTVAGGTIELEDFYFTTATSGTGKIASATSASRAIVRRITATNLFAGFGGYWNDSIFEKNDLTITGSPLSGSYIIHFAGSRNKVIGNTFHGGRHQVYISGGTETPGEVVEGTLVNGNICIAAELGALATNASSTQGAVQYNEFSDNIVINTVAGHPIDINANSKSINIKDNLIVGFAGGHGIFIEGEASTDANKRPEDNIVENNTVICTVANDTTYHNIKLLNALRTIIKGNPLIRPSTDTSLTTSGLWIDSQTTPKADGTQAIGNTFTFCSLNNQTVDNTLIEGNSFNVHAGMVPIKIDPGGTANVGSNNLGGAGAFVTFTDGDTTPSVANGFRFKTANTGATFITTLDDNYIGQPVEIMFTDANTTLGDASQAGGGIFRLLGAVNFVSSPYDTITLVKTGATEWWEKSRSVN